MRGDGFAGCRHPNAVFNNAVVLVPPAVSSARRLFDDDDPFALWCRGSDSETAAALESAGFRRDVTTCPMRCNLADADLPVDSMPVLADVDLARIAELNGLPGDVLVGVPGARGFATRGFDSGLVLIEIGSDVNVSFVATRPDARGRGLAAAVTTAALRDAVHLGSATASLQATPMAQALYAKLGFAPIARIQEWLPP